MRKTFLLFIVLFVSCISFAQDIAGSKDHPLLSRYPGSSIKYYFQRNYAELALPTAVKDAKPSAFVEAKGVYTSILYKGPEKVSTLEIFRNYEQAIKAANGKILFSCKGKYAPGGCDDYNRFYGLKFFSELYSRRERGTDQYLYVQQGSEQQAFLVAVFEKDQKNIYVEIGINGKFLSHPSSIQIEIVEAAVMESDLITVDIIAKQLKANGKLTLKGVYFDTGKSSLKSSSKAVLDEVVTYLTNHPSEKFYIVGHTDDQGSAAANVQLSRERAETVTNYLRNKGVSSGRVQAQGVGPYAPVASNAQESGRQRNRRVEIVKRY